MARDREQDYRGSAILGELRRIAVELNEQTDRLQTLLRALERETADAVKDDDARYH